MRVLALVVALVAMLGGAPPAAAQPAPEKEQVIDLGGLRIHRTRQMIEIDGKVSLDRGLIELFACSPAGKAYESVLVLSCQPYHLMTGLILLGQKRGTGGRFQGDPTQPTGSKVVLLALWTDPVTQKPRRHMAEDLVWNQRTGKPMERAGWVFVGSRFARNPSTGRELFMANVTGTMIVTYHDPEAILDTPLEAGADDTSFYANHHLLPPRGTELKLRLYPEKVYQALPSAEKALPVPPVPGGGARGGAQK